MNTTSVSAATSTYLCRCLKVAADDVREAILLKGLETVQEVRQTTKAGTGCMACHCKIKQLIREYNENRIMQSCE